MAPSSVMRVRKWKTEVPGLLDKVPGQMYQVWWLAKLNIFLPTTQLVAEQPPPS